MQNLQKLLERFSRALDKDGALKSVVIETVQKKTGAQLKKENISLKEGVLEISAGASMKNELKLKESAILEELALRGVKIGRVLYK